MKTAAVLILLLLVLLVAGLYAWRLLDHRADRHEAGRLKAMQGADPLVFNMQMVDGLPDPARRFFRFAIAEGTPLFAVAEISMRGQFGMGDKAAPNYMPMRARQVLAAPHGFVWKMSGGSGLMRISGSDSAGWTRFWLAGVLPVARAGGTSDHRLSAFGRFASEAVFWTPAVVLPGPNVVWEPVDDTTARVTLAHDGMSQSVDVTVDQDGRPIRVVLQRWSNANVDNTFRWQPFGGTLSEFRDFDGFRLPTHVEAGNLFGTDAYFPFFIADITVIRFNR